MSNTGRKPIAPGSEVLIPKWIALIVLLGACLLGVGAIIALLRPSVLLSPHDEITDAVRIYAGYMASRNLALAILLLATLAIRARQALNSFVLLTGFIQVFDAGVDSFERRFAIVPVVLSLGILFFLASARLAGHPFWRVESGSPKELV